MNEGLRTAIHRAMAAAQTAYFSRQIGWAEYLRVIQLLHQSTEAAE